MSGDDHQDWLDEIEGVKPLKGKKKPKRKLTEMAVDDWEDLAELPQSKNTTKEAEAFSSLVSDYQQKVATSTPFKVHSNIASKLSGSVAGFDVKLMKKLSSGKIAPEAKIDLHGFYLDDAFKALMDFINKATFEGLRCIIIVHGKGKGYGPKKDMGIIKANVPGWLNGHPKVLAYHSASIQHGGNGAMYVLLKKQN